MADFKTRLIEAVKYVKCQRKIGIDIGLAISNASIECDVDRTQLAQEMSRLAAEVKAARIKARADAKAARFANWHAIDARRYGDN